ncbi:hypothetical protein ACFCT7_00350 [Fulvivirgaceae bacterium LMO-SS25]
MREQKDLLEQEFSDIEKYRTVVFSEKSLHRSEKKISFIEKDEKQINKLGLSNDDLAIKISQIGGFYFR